MGRMRKEEKELYQNLGMAIANLVRKCEKTGYYEVFHHRCDDKEHIVLITIERVKENNYGKNEN